MQNKPFSYCIAVNVSTKEVNNQQLLAFFFVVNILVLSVTITWHGRYSVSNHRRLVQNLFIGSNKNNIFPTPVLLHLCGVNLPMTGGFPSQNANNAGRVFVLWGHVSCRSQRYNFRIAKWIYLFVKQGLSFPEHGNSFYGPWWSLAEEWFLDPGRKMAIKSYSYYKILLKQILWQDQACTLYIFAILSLHNIDYCTIFSNCPLIWLCRKCECFNLFGKW